MQLKIEDEQITDIFVTITKLQQVIKSYCSNNCL